MRIFLIGFMGSGKSYCGRELAKLLGAPFIDLDEYVEAKAGAPISEIFANRNEEYFRELERDVLLSITPLPTFVMATGGGTPCHHDLITHLNEVGTTVFLDPPVDLLVERLRAEIDHRPLLAQSGELPTTVREKLQLRRPCYERAQIHLRFDNNDEDVARLVFDRLSEQPLS
ncbi:shikimate kinase [Lewinella sp. JB7]|uniref:shikimate kinase n=1 Tax=Lewinella sp. JB7 TaxID=2962887 RepID=UPI0020CA0F2D|nr:shikimate kinase [Lewinella sp. JB7]MCP9235113.1 shikimate kinase [Lewinella sp. JB7]